MLTEQNCSAFPTLQNHSISLLYEHCCKEVNPAHKRCSCVQTNVGNELSYRLSWHPVAEVTLIRERLSFARQ